MTTTYVTENRNLTSVDGLVRIWTQPLASPQYYPLVFTTFWLERQGWGLNPFGYHLVNVLLHACVAGLLYYLLLCLEVPGAWLAALVFAVHPVNVETTAWITERKNLLSGFFYMLSAIALLVLRGEVQAKAKKKTNHKAEAKRLAWTIVRSAPLFLLRWCCSCIVWLASPFQDGNLYAACRLAHCAVVEAGADCDVAMR